MKQGARWILVFAISAGLVGAAGVFAQVSETDQLQQIRADMAADRQALVAANLGLTDEEGEGFWPLYRDLEGDSRSLRQTTDNAYLGLTRNLQRFGWLIPYLFGASPAVCKSFMCGKPTSLQEFDENTNYEPYATSLRLGDADFVRTSCDVLCGVVRE